MLKSVGSPSFCPATRTCSHNFDIVANCGMYQYDARTAAITPDFRPFLQCFRAAQSAGGATKMANVHFVSIPNPQKTPNTTDQRLLVKSFVFTRAQIESATRAVSEVSISVSREIHNMNGKKFTSMAATAAAAGFMIVRPTP